MRVLPERTSDAWAAWYLLHRFPAANLWAPSQNDPLALDFSVDALPGKGFVIENKGVLDRPRGVRLSIRQLAWYALVVEATKSTAVYYLLPTFPITRPITKSPAGAAPSSADMRLKMPFEKASFIVALEDLLRHVAQNAPRHHARQLIASLHSGNWYDVSPHYHFYFSQAELTVFTQAMTLETFCDRLLACDDSVGFHYFTRMPAGPLPRYAALRVRAGLEPLTSPRWRQSLDDLGLDVDSAPADPLDDNRTPRRENPATAMTAMLIPGRDYDYWQSELRG